MRIPRSTVYVAMSGGVDSSVAALLLKRAGHRVVGVFMRPWQPRGFACLWERDRADALQVAAKLGIPLETWDFSRQYAASVARPMVSGYRRGVTPNPDVDCNRHIKFGLFAERAFREGADFIATGHYARTVRAGGRVHLAAAADRNKDQTYFLWAVPSRALERTLFPLGGLTKPEVRRLAHRAGLVTATKPDSQGVCFVGDLDVKSFLQTHIRPRRGRILHTDGRVLGFHDGAAYYTVGQRHGLDIRDGGGPYYVTRTDVRRNTVTVGPESALYASTARITGAHWLAAAPVAGDRVRVQVRYRGPAVPAVMGGRGRIRFLRPVRAIAPGQSAVVYRGSRLLGGGILA